MQIKKRLLFVAPDEIVGDIFQQRFQCTHDVFTATSGAEALKITATQDIEVMVTDSNLADMSGLELWAIVRECSAVTVGILLVEKSELPSLADSASDVGIFRVISKPWAIEALRPLVEDACEIAMLKRDMAPKTKWEPLKASTAQEIPVSEQNADLTAEVEAQVVSVAASTVSAPAPQADQTRPALLVLVGSEVDRLEIMQLFAEKYRVLGAADVSEALKALKQNNVGVLLCEAHVSNKSTGPFLRMLKLSHDTVQTVMLTSTFDKDLVLKMINQVQIFRFVMKPVVRPLLLTFAVSAAMKQHVSLHLSQRTIRQAQAARAIEPESVYW